MTADSRPLLAEGRRCRFVGLSYVIIKGWPIVLREMGWERPDEH